MGGLAPATAESLLGQLSREACQLRSRAGQVLGDLGRCNSPVLAQRLQREFQSLDARRDDLRRLCQQLRRERAWRDSLSLELVEELCRRPLPAA